MAAKRLTLERNAAGTLFEGLAFSFTASQST